jgi:hypothetical protein
MHSSSMDSKIFSPQGPTYTRWTELFSELSFSSKLEAHV